MNRNVSTTQFGFIHRDVTPPFEKLERASKPSRRQLPLDTPLVTDQATMQPDVVTRYTAKPPPAVPLAALDDHRGAIKVWGYGREMWVEDGHHRIAAARQRGDTHIEVVHRRAYGDLRKSAEEHNKRLARGR